jgi:polysaccharide pyruvyl transferase WcaK-like protein
MNLHVTHEAAQGGIRRTARLLDGQKEVEIFFDMDGVDVGPPAVLDGFVFGVIYHAMRLRENLQVRGAMTRSALLNLNEFQEAWALWKPLIYHKIKIIPDSIVDCVPAMERKAIAAFSGGVDSIFTILRHKTKALGNGSYPLNDSVLMVHGFDVPLAAPDHLESLKKRTRPFLDELDLKLLTIRTNLKELDLQDWEDSYTAQLACCLNNYSDEFCYALVASGDPYDALTLPWGSNPATDCLLSGDTMRIVHDGAGYSRTEKVAQISTRKTAMEAVKVCWEGRETYKNCGVCEKCVRTQLNFRAAGVEHASCFDRPLDSQLVERMLRRNVIYANELKSIHAYATKTGINAEWVETVAECIERFDNPPSKLLAKSKAPIEPEETQTEPGGQRAINQAASTRLHTELPRQTAEYQGITRSPDLPQLLFLADVYASSPHVGDEAMLEANVSLFRRLFPGCGVNVAAGADWDGTHFGARAIPRMEFGVSEAERDALLQLPHPALESACPAARAALSCDALIISGGGNLTSIWPHLLCERLAMARLASSKGAPVIILGQTLGPELRARDRELLKELLKLSAWTGLRETYSYSLALELGADPDTLSYQVDDATFLTPTPAPKDGSEQSDRPLIAVTVQPVGETGTGKPVIATLADSLRTIAKKTEAELIFIPHVDFPSTSDSALGEAIGRALDGNPPLRILPVLPAAQTMWLTQQASMVISTRYHPLVFALAAAVPAVGIWTDDYTRRKLEGALIHAGRPGDAMSLDEALAGGLTAKALQLWDSRASFRDELRRRVTKWRRDEEMRFAKLGDLLRTGRNQMQRAKLLAEEANRSKGLPDALVDRDRTIGTAEDRMDDLQSELASAKARLASVYSSRSWRLTKTLRWCDDIQRRVVERVRRRFGAETKK